MPAPLGLSHVAMSVAEGTLTAEYRANLVDFYGRTLGWTEIESLGRADRLTVSVGSVTYLNIREQAEPMLSNGYEHFGVILESAAALSQLWSALASNPLVEELEELHTNSRGEGSFRFRYLLPMAVEGQYHRQLIDPAARG